MSESLTLSAKCEAVARKSPAPEYGALPVMRNHFLVLAVAFSIASCNTTSGQARTHGKVEGNTYVDSRFGLRYTFPGFLETQASLNGMPVGTGEKVGASEFLLDAMEKPNGQIRSGVFITSDEKGALGATNARQFLILMLAQAMRVKGEPDIRSTTIAGRTFYRSDVGGGGSVHFYGAQLATDCNGHYLVFWFSAGSSEKMEGLVRSMNEMEMKCSASIQ